MSWVKLYDTKSMQELQAMQRDLSNDPANREEGGIFLYNRKTRKKLEDIGLAITKHLEDAREARGYAVVCDGYSGRQSNRR